MSISLSISPHSASRALGPSTTLRAPQRDESSHETAKNPRELSEAEQKRVEELKRIDKEVRQHEQAHQSAAGGYARGKSFSYTLGPDNKRYAVSGEVKIDLSEVPNDPQATIEKMRVVRRAALAPKEPSSQDRQVAAKAQQIEARAQRELREQRQQPGSLIDAVV